MKCIISYRLVTTNFDIAAELGHSTLPANRQRVTDVPLTPVRLGEGGGGKGAGGPDTPAREGGSKGGDTPRKGGGGHLDSPFSSDTVSIL